MLVVDYTSKINDIYDSLASIDVNIEEGEILYAEISKCEKSVANLCIGSALVGMYAKCGCLVKAREILENLPARDVVLWTALIGGYVEYGHNVDALMCMKEMQCQGIQPNDFTLVCFLKACQGLKDADESQRIHDYIVCMGYERDSLIGNVLVDVYGKCGCLLEARNLFEKMENRTVISWTALIAGYVEAGDGHEALECFRKMRLDQISPDASTFVCCLKSSSLLVSITEGRELHTEIAMKGFENNHLVTATLIDMYTKCELLTEAQDIFDRNVDHDVVLWTALIGGYVAQGYSEEALKCLERMENGNFSMNAVTFACIFQACSCIRSVKKSQEVHIKVVKKGMEKEPIAGSALTNMYCKLGRLEDAQNVAKKLPDREVVVWTALMDGYVEHGFAEKTLEIFQQMQHEGIEACQIAFVSVLTACSNLHALHQGKLIHTHSIVT